MNEIQLKNSLSELEGAITRGIEAWKQAGEIVCSLVDAGGMTLTGIAERIGGGVSENVLAQFERIGRGQLLPKLLVAEYPAARKLQTLALSEQRDALEHGVELLVLRDGGQTETLRVQADAMTPKQVKQVFARGSIRSLGAQRAWLEEQRAAESTSAGKVGATPWVVRGRKVFFREGCEVSSHELTAILSQLI